MYGSKSNIKFEYLYRDSSNYKQFGQLIFPNPTNLNAEHETLKFKDKLIDKEFFYPLKAGVPKFDVDEFEFEMNWYEFIKFSNTEESPTEKISIETFINSFNT